MRVEHEPLVAIVARREMSPDEWIAAIDEKLRRRDYELAGYEPLPGVTLTLARQQEDKPNAEDR